MVDIEIKLKINLIIIVYIPVFFLIIEEKIIILYAL